MRQGTNNNFGKTIWSAHRLAARAAIWPVQGDTPEHWAACERFDIVRPYAKAVSFASPWAARVTVQHTLHIHTLYIRTSYMCAVPRGRDTGPGDSDP